jgi:hypothetical protein
MICFAELVGENTDQGVCSLETPTKAKKLCGNWLEELGFYCGKRVVVEAKDGLLILKPDTQ